ncbi:hypothetical protein [Paenibacillus sp. 2TAB26]|uniref:hypothetical protein n=1 Tax=Paenibacillus sp. 2TAB26 TaxID=3233005 RepID=UPI003F956FFB
MEWVKVGGTESGNNITRDVNHFTKYAIFAVAESATRQQWASAMPSHNGGGLYQASGKRRQMLEQKY